MGLGFAAKFPSSITLKLVNFIIFLKVSRSTIKLSNSKSPVKSPGRWPGGGYRGGIRWLKESCGLQLGIQSLDYQIDRPFIPFPDVAINTVGDKLQPFLKRL